MSAPLLSLCWWNSVKIKRQFLKVSFFINIKKFISFTDSTVIQIGFNHDVNCFDDPIAENGKSNMTLIYAILEVPGVNTSWIRGSVDEYDLWWLIIELLRVRESPPAEKAHDSGSAL